MLLWNLFLRNNEVILYDSVQVVTFSFCMWPFTAVCVCLCLITSDKWKEKNCTLDPYSEGSMALVRYEALLLGFCLLRVASGSQTVDDHGREKKNKKKRTTPNQWFLQKTNKQKKSTVILFHYSAVYNWNLSLSPSHPIPGLLHYSHESSLKSFSFPPTSTIFIILCPTDLLLSPLNVSKPSHPQLSTFSVRAVPLLHSFL